MRVISGFLKGKLINFIQSSTTRPLKDSVKENIFNIINHSKHILVDLKNSQVLDLYSGIGSFGIECISRGAKKVVFVEKNSNAIEILKKNLIDLSIINKVNIKSDEIEEFLKKPIKEKFDIIFLDPPFAENNYVKDLEIIKKKNMLSSKHLVIIHRERKSKDNLESVLDILITKEYGRSKILFGKF